MRTLKSERVKLKAKRTYLKKGTCSRTFFYLLDREFGQAREEEEKAIDPMAGGILQQGYQCGMLWGASMAVGAESYRRNPDPSTATGIAIKATRHVMNSFAKRTSSIECEDITQTDFQNKRSFARYMLSGRFVNCFILAGKWAPEALAAAIEGLALNTSDLPERSLSCASEVVRSMGAREEQSIMVAGFAGGLGLSGSGCGALAAAIWMKALVHNRSRSDRAASYDPSTDPTLQAFYLETDYQMTCGDICGRHFDTIGEHTDYLEKGGCKKLMKVLAE